LFSVSQPLTRHIFPLGNWINGLIQGKLFRKTDFPQNSRGFHGFPAFPTVPRVSVPLGDDWGLEEATTARKNSRVDKLRSPRGCATGQDPSDQTEDLGAAEGGRSRSSRSSRSPENIRWVAFSHGKNHGGYGASVPMKNSKDMEQPWSTWWFLLERKHQKWWTRVI
jgi:hypothetical protein